MKRPGWLAILAGAAMTAALACGADEPEPPPGATSASAERVVVDGAATLESTITVQFNRPVEFAESRVPVESHFEIDVPDPFNPEGDPLRVLVASVDEVVQNSRTITLHVRALIPRGSTLRIAERAFRPDAEGEIAVEIASDLSGLAAVLGAIAVEPADPSILDPGAGPLPVSEADRDPAAVRRTLEAHLEARSTPSDGITAALEAYDEIPAELVPPPKLRAALAALTGTFAEPTIADLLTAENCQGTPIATMTFQEPPDAPDLLGRVTFDEEGRRIISINPALEGEPLGRLMPVVAHEALHCDEEDSYAEEIAATALDTLLFLTLVIADPEVLEEASPLRTELVSLAISMVNSGGRFPESMGILPSAGVERDVPPFSTYGSFADRVAASYDAMPTVSADEQLALQYAAIIAASAGVPLNTPFNLVYLDQLIGAIFTEDLMLAALDALVLLPAE